MSEREAFGPNLRRIRVQRGISLEQIVGGDQCQRRVVGRAGAQRLLALAERHLRARLRARYAKAIGVDPEATVDEFCRWFPAGRSPRRARDSRQAEIVGHDDLQWRDDHVPPVAGDGDRRGAAAAAPRRPSGADAVAR